MSGAARRADFPVRSGPKRQRARVNCVAADWKVRAPLFRAPSLTDYTGIHFSFAQLAIDSLD